MTQNSTVEKLDVMQVFIGTWRTEGKILDVDDGTQDRLEATDTYEWGLGKKFILHYVDGVMGENEVKALEVVGTNEDGSELVCHSFDNSGAVGTYQANLDGHQWTITGDTQKFSGEFDSTFQTLKGDWHMLEDGDWRHWMSIVLTKS